MVFLRVRFFLLLCIVYSLIAEEVLENEYPLIFEEHIPWILDGAEERIDKFRKGDAFIKISLENGENIPKESEFSITQLNHEFYFGGSLSSDWSAPSQYWFQDFKNYFSNLFNYATINFYWGSHEKEKGNWDYNKAPLSRDILDWAISKNMKLKGHPLIWHQVLPDWISSKDRDVKEIDVDVRNHIGRLIKSYPEINHWDTYNEIPGIRWEDEDLGMRRWQKYIGNEVIDGEFTSGPGPVIKEVMSIARPLLPDGYFVLNHYDHTDTYYHQQIQYCIENNIDFEAIGIQTHMHNVTQSFKEKDLWDMLETYSEYGKPLHLSEVSILSCGKYEDWKGLKVQNDKWDYAINNNLKIPTLQSLPKEEIFQANLTRDFYILAFSHPNVEVITWWTMSDLDPWRGMPCGLLDAKGNPKPVYYVLDSLINKEWNTELSGTFNPQREINFRGFYGEYEIFLEIGNKVYTTKFSLKKDSENNLDLILKELK